MQVKVLVGFTLISVSLGVVASMYDSSAMIFIAISLSLLLLAVLTGRKIAYLIHDSHVLKKKSRGEFSPTGLLSLWMLMFIIAVIIYTITMQLFFKLSSLVISSLLGKYLGLIASVLTIIGSYILFSTLADAKGDILLSSWGKRISRVENATKSMISATSKVMDTMEKFMS